jgi:hypothetical protein
MYNHALYITINGRSENSSEIVFREEFTQVTLNHLKLINLYDIVMNPKEFGITKANDLIIPFSKGLYTLSGLDENHRDGEMKLTTAFNLMKILIKCINKCIDYPDARVLVTE